MLASRERASNRILLFIIVCRPSVRLLLRLVEQSQKRFLICEVIYREQEAIYHHGSVRHLTPSQCSAGRARARPSNRRKSALLVVVVVVRDNTKMQTLAHTRTLKALVRPKFTPVDTVSRVVKVARSQRTTPSVVQVKRLRFY